MKEHLTKEEIDRFRNRKMSANEILAIDDHLAECSECLSLLTNEDGLDSAITSLRRYIESSGSEDSYHPLKEELAAFAGNNTDEADREIISSHIENCSQCREELLRLRGEGNRASIKE